MSTVKLTELPEITTIDSNQSNTIFVVVDTDSDTTAKITYGTLYANVHSLMTANADSANSVINTRITANAESANSVINTRITANSILIRDDILANAESTNAFANLAFTKANNALANTTGIFDGSLNVTGNISANYAMSIHNASMPGNGIFLLITGSAGSAYGTPSNPGYTIQTVGPDGEGNRVVSEAYASKSSGYSSFIGRRARGTAASPTAVQTNDIIVRFGGNAYGATKFSQFADARIEFVATENHTDSSKGTQIQFWTTPSGSSTASQIGVMSGSSVTFTGSVEPQKGFVYTPRVIHTNQTTLTIDYSQDSMIKANLDQNMTISHTNFVPGKLVEVWLENTSTSQNRTVTHGLSALNSTNKSTSDTITSSSTMLLRFFSIDSDLANTFVAITG